MMYGFFNDGLCGIQGYGGLIFMVAFWIIMALLIGWIASMFVKNGHDHYCCDHDNKKNVPKKTSRKK